MIKIPKISNIKPTLNISFVWIILVPNTMVLAAVATGSIKPMEDANVAGIINNKGDTSIFFCKAIITGIANCILAILLANSLIIVTIQQIPKIINRMGTPLRTINWLANQLLNPVTSKP